ncbi:unnamed protein product [Closterium sp. Yama58-4]|nr:unnamed protein product [Closterium sp. Yama58-4]
MAVAAFEAYKDWVRRNRQWLSSAESMANVSESMANVSESMANVSESMANVSESMANVSESMAHTLTWLLPDRLAESEIAPEALSTLIGVISVINDHIIETAPTEAPPQANSRSHRPAREWGREGGEGWGGRTGVRIGGRESGRGEAGEAAEVRGEGEGEEEEGGEGKGGIGMVPWALVLAVVKEGEVLGEMAAEQWLGEEGKWTAVAGIEAVKEVLEEMAAEQWLGEDGKWTAVAGIEAVKAAIRLLLLHRDRWRLLIGGGSTENPGPSKPSPTPSNSSSLQAQQPSLYQQQQQQQQHSTGGPMGYSGGNGGNHRGVNGQQAATTRALAGATSAAHVEDGSATSAACVDDGDTTSAGEKSPALSKTKQVDWIRCMHVTAELIHIFRPLLYVLAIRAVARSARSRAEHSSPLFMLLLLFIVLPPSLSLPWYLPLCSFQAQQHSNHSQGSQAGGGGGGGCDGTPYVGKYEHPLEGIRSLVRPIPLLGSLAERGDRKGLPENAKEGITQERLVEARLASLVAAEPLAAALRETLSEVSGVREAVRQEGAVQAELGEVVSEVARFQEQHRKWAAAFNELHTAIKEIGDFENWMKVMERDIALVTTTVEIVTQSPKKP